MKFAIIHISDFHVTSNKKFLDLKLESFRNSLNVLGQVDDAIIVFTGDLTSKGEVNEFRSGRYLLAQIINLIKDKFALKYINLYEVPGNHDISLPADARDFHAIQGYYDSNSIESQIENEFTLLNNYFDYVKDKKIFDTDKFICIKKKKIAGYNLQINMINTALFSTKELNNKELHYFPIDKLNELERSDEIDCCLTIMHHSVEWFNWKYKYDLERTLTDNSEIIFIGHDHKSKLDKQSIDNNQDVWNIYAGEINFSSLEGEDSYNAIIIDTENNLFDFYKFDWNKSSKIFIHNHLKKKQELLKHSKIIKPNLEYIKDLKEDTYNASKDFSNYFTFPKLISESKNEYGKRSEIKEMSELVEFIDNNKKVRIIGSANSGKTTLFKALYLYYIGNKVPLILNIESTSKINPKNFIKSYFEEQYGKNAIIYEKFKQLDKEDKIILIDGWDLIENSNAKKKILEEINNEFYCCVLGENKKTNNIVDSMKEDLLTEEGYKEINIKPFFAEKRNELIRKVCISQNETGEQEISNCTKLVNSIVENNIGMFSLNPGFIVKYTNCFLEDSHRDYIKGEKTFSKVFQHELEHSIFQFSKEQHLDETLIILEQVAGSMFENRNDIISAIDFVNIIDNYNIEYGDRISYAKIRDIVIKSKVLKELEDGSLYFRNKSHLAYFIAKYLIRTDQEKIESEKGIYRVLREICFGINSDIFMFITYLTNSKTLLNSIIKQAEELLEEYEKLSLDTKNILVLFKQNIDEIPNPSTQDRKEYISSRDKQEELLYEEEVEITGLLKYDESTLDEYYNKLLRAVKYTEIIVKALPSFYSTLKLDEKRKLVKAFYDLPSKIIYALLKPIDCDFEFICEDLLSYTLINDIKKDNGDKYSKEDITEMLNSYSKAAVLSYYDHFAELITNNKTKEHILEYEHEDISEELEKLLVIENLGDSEKLLSKALELLDKSKEPNVDSMVKLIVRKHILCTPNITYKMRQKISDKIFGKGSAKMFLN